MSLISPTGSGRSDLFDAPAMAAMPSRSASGGRAWLFQPGGTGSGQILGVGGPWQGGCIASDCRRNRPQAAFFWWVSARAAILEASPGATTDFHHGLLDIHELLLLCQRKKLIIAAGVRKPGRNSREKLHSYAKVRGAGNGKNS